MPTAPASDMDEGWDLFRKLGVLAHSYRTEGTLKGRFIGWWLKKAQRLIRADLRP